MPDRARRARRGWILLTAAVASGTVAVLALLALAGWDAAYASRVLVHRGSSTADHEWKAHGLAVEPSAPRSATPTDCSADPHGDAAVGWRGEKVRLADYLEASAADALVIVRDGATACEWTRDGAVAIDPHAAFSVSKTVLALLVARAVEAGELDYDDPITRHVAELRDRDARFEEITIGDLVDMRSGIAFDADVGFPWVTEDQTAIYFASDIVETVLDRSTIEAPSGEFRYNDYAPNLVGLALERASGTSAVDEPFADLWRSLPAEAPAWWLVDDHGFAWHESGLMVAPRDLARLGSEVLAVTHGAPSEAVPASFVERSLDPEGRAHATVFGDVAVAYRNGWWLLDDGAGGVDLVAMGDHGQLVLVSPSNRAVVVRMGTDTVDETNIDIARTLQRLAAGS